MLGRLGEAGPAVKIRHWAYDLRTWAADHPSIYLPFARVTHPAGPGKILVDDTEIVIDGFTRSASTFALIAFQLSQPRPVRTGHHTHAPAHLIAAARRGLPVLVPVREPEPTILSLVVREPHVSMTQALKSYARFYTTLRPYREDFVIATFDEVTGDFGAVIRRVNARFGTTFAAFEHTEANVKRCFDLIEDRSRRQPWAQALSHFQSGLIGLPELERAIAQHDASTSAAPVSEHLVARPSSERRKFKEASMARWQDADLARLRERAEAAYTAFVSGTVARANPRWASV
jgi:hypothetical protein